MTALPNGFQRGAPGRQGAYREMHASGFSRGTVPPSSLESSTRADREGGEFWNLAYVGPNPGLPDFSCASSGNTCISAQPPSRGWGSAPRGCRQEGQVCGARCCLAGPRFPSQHDGMSHLSTEHVSRTECELRECVWSTLIHF